LIKNKVGIYAVIQVRLKFSPNLILKSVLALCFNIFNKWRRFNWFWPRGFTCL